jgi:replicative DNA helicase
MALAEIPPSRTARPAGRVPPHNLEAEESLLGAMLLSKDAIVAATEVGVAADEFYKPAHGHIFEAITSLYGAGEPADPVTVAEELNRAGLLEAMGGPALLVTLQARTPATSSAARYARIVSEHALLRRLIGVAGEIAELGYALPDDVIAAVDRAESMVFDVAQRRVTDTTAPIRELLDASLTRLEMLYEKGDAITGVPTGYHGLDELLSGLQPSSLVIVGARPAQGKTAFSLGIASHVALEANRPVLFFSLEMSHLEITQRILSAEARVDATRMRNGRLAEADWTKISHAIGRLAEAPLYIDDNPQATVMEIRSKARRLRSRLGDLGLVVIDYLQLMTGRTRAENRQVEVSEISRGLKVLARELACPVLALSQLSRNLELRQDKRPMLADLRESGCLTADTRVLRADTGAEISLGELLLRGERDIPVWSLDDRLQLVAATMTHVFPSGVKETFELRLASGHRVKASANHPFLTLDGWTRLDRLEVGTRIAVPRAVPEPLDPVTWPEAEVVMLAHLLGDGCVAPRQPVRYTSADPANIEAVEAAAGHFGITPRRVRQQRWWHVYLPAPYPQARGRRNPVQAWLAPMGLDHLRSHEKFVPPGVFSLPRSQAALFLRHLWATDGSVGFHRHQARIYYASTSRRLVDDVQRLLLRFDVRSRVKEVRKGDHRPGYHLYVHGAENQLRFIEEIGVHGARGEDLPAIAVRLRDIVGSTTLDTVPIEVWDEIRDRMRETGLSARALAARMGTASSGSALYERAPGRERLGALATVLDDPRVGELASSGVFWDEVVAVVALGEEPVYDATVAGTHNFIADGIVVHNSLEQDADVVMFLYRDETYNPESADRGTAEVLVAKHRAGPTGMDRLAFLDHYTRFANMARGV